MTSNWLLTKGKGQEQALDLCEDTLTRYLIWTCYQNTIRSIQVMHVVYHISPNNRTLQFSLMGTQENLQKTITFFPQLHFPYSSFKSKHRAPYQTHAPWYFTKRLHFIRCFLWFCLPGQQLSRKSPMSRPFSHSYLVPFSQFVCHIPFQ